MDVPVLGQNNLREAACKDLDEGMKNKFYGAGFAAVAAKRICNGEGARPACPVRAACLASARAIEESPRYEGDRHGVWGGMTATEREVAFPRPPRIPVPDFVLVEREVALNAWAEEQAS